MSTYSLDSHTITITPSNGTTPSSAVSGCYIDGHNGQYALGMSVELVDELIGTNFAAEFPHDEAGNLAGTYGANGPWSMGDDHVEICVEVADRAEAALNAATEGGYWRWEDGEFFLCADLETYFCGACDGEFDDPVAAELCCETVEEFDARNGD
jgi:hypothetical protein